MFTIDYLYTATTTTTILHGSHTDANDEHERLETRQNASRVFFLHRLYVFDYHHHINERERERTGMEMETRKDGDGSTKGAQMTKKSFVVCALGLRRVSSPVCFFFTI